MKAIILAGGASTRLRPLTNTIPKALLPIDHRNLTEHIFALLKTHGIEEMILSLGYLSEKIIHHFREGKGHGISIDYLVEKKPMGTAAPLILLKRSGNIPKEDFLLINGDNLFSFNITDFIKYHKSHPGVGTVALYEVPDPSSYGVVDMQDNKILRFIEKPKKEEAPSCLINSGYSILSPEIFDYVSADAEFAMYETHIYPRLAECGLLYGFLGKGQWFDMGTPERYEQVKKEWKGVL